MFYHIFSKTHFTLLVYADIWLENPQNSSDRRHQILPRQIESPRLVGHNLQRIPLYEIETESFQRSRHFGVPIFFQISARFIRCFSRIKLLMHAVASLFSTTTVVQSSFSSLAHNKNPLELSSPIPLLSIRFISYQSQNVNPLRQIKLARCDALVNIPHRSTFPRVYMRLYARSHT